MHLTADVRMWNHSGIGTYIQGVLPVLCRLYPEWEITLLGSAERPTWAAALPARWLTMNSPIYSLAEQFELLRLVPADTDVLWSPHFNTPWLYRGKLAATVHDLLPLARPDFMGRGKQLAAYWYLWRLKKQASRIITVSHFSAQELQRYLQVPKSQMKVIPHGVDPFWSEGGREDALLAGMDKPYFLFVGNIKPHKNGKALLEAMKRLEQDLPHRLLLVGQKEGFRTGDGELLSAAEALGERVLFTGRISREELRCYYQQATALLFPSVYEGFGLPVLEAMAAGCPVLSSDAASLPEVAGEAALYFKAEDATSLVRQMRLLCGDASVGRRLRELGKERSRQFSWEKSAASHGRVFQKIALTGK